MTRQILVFSLAWLMFNPVVRAQRTAVVPQRLPVILSSTVDDAEVQGREELLAPGVERSAANVASATRRPWIDANGWNFVRHPDGEYYYDLPRGTAPLAAAEAFAYNADAVLRIDPADSAVTAKMLGFLRQLPPRNLPTIADIGVIDDDSYDVGEVMNLLARRNLLFKVVVAPAPQFRVNITLGSEEFPLEAADDPSEFAQMVRRKLGDENRSLRLYGTEMALCHWTGDGSHARLHLLNYSGREIAGPRVRLRGKYGDGTANAFGLGPVELQEVVVDETATEFSLARMGIYAVVDLPVAPVANKSNRN